MHRSVLLFAAILAVSGVSAYADQGQGQSIIAKWKTMDVCTRQAHAAFPDNNVESNTKREAQVKNCLIGNNLPPREPFATPGAR